MSKTVFIAQSNYIPWKGFFDAINQVDEYIIFDELQYTRRDWRNRNKIVTQTGLKWLTIPISTKGKFFQKINETRTMDSKWRHKHWKTLCVNYGRAPYFQMYAETIERLYLGSDERSLSLINQEFIVAINEILGIDTKITRCEDYGLIEGKNERLLDLCIKSGASDYFTGPAAMTYLEPSLFAEAGIFVHWLDYGEYPEYAQLHARFEHAVTILDLLFNTGKSAHRYMKSFRV